MASSSFRRVQVGAPPSMKRSSPRIHPRCEWRRRAGAARSTGNILATLRVLSSVSAPARGLMPARQLVVAAAILLGGAAAQAGAAPPILRPPGAFLQSNHAVETVRWRHRHYRDFFWNGR